MFIQYYKKVIPSLTIVTFPYEYLDNKAMDKIDIHLVFDWDLLDLVSIGLLIFLFFWGFITLYYKWSKKVQLPIWVEIFSLILMLVILAIEIIKLREWLTNYPLIYLFSVLGLFIAISALYSHSIISVISSLIINIIVPGEELAPDTPRFGPAEILERQKDYQGALNEYLVLARIYPHHTSVHLRIANVLEKMNKKEDALNWLEKSLKYVKKDEDAYVIVARYCDLAQELGKIGPALSIIDRSLATYPDSIHAQSLIKRKKILSEHRSSSKKATILVKLSEQPLTDSEEPPEDSQPPRSSHPSPPLEPL